MSKTLSLPGRPSARRRSKVERSRRILSGASASATGLLLLWLIVSALLGRGPAGKSGLVLALEPPATVVDVQPTIARDSDEVAEALGLAGGGATAGAGDLSGRIEAFSAASTGPKVVFLSAVGVSSSAGGEGAEPFLLPVGGDPNDPGTLVPARELLAELADRAKAGGPTLLVLDVAQVDSDRGTGVFANGFLHRLEGLVPEDGNLVVLTPCSPGQVSWAAEPFGRSVFTDTIARSAAWGRGTVSDLFEEVSARVSAWARAHRDAEQTPRLLGNVRRVDFRLPPLRGTLADPSPAEPSDELKAVLRKAWESHRSLASWHPERLAPLAWRRLQDELLRAERLVRLGRTAEAESALKAVDSLADSIRDRSGADSPAGLPSFALRLAMASPADREAIDREWQVAREAIARSLDDEDEVAPSDRDGPAPASAPAATPAAAADAPAGEQPAATPAPTTPAAAEPGSAAVGAELAAALPTITALRPSAEGLLALRYRQFVGLGGEQDGLESDRLDGLRLAARVAEAAEKAAAVDGRLLPWIGPIVDEGDRRRLEGQDLLFAADPERIRSAAEPLREAEARYADAVALAGPLAEAVAVLQELADVMPYYGEWAAPTLANHAMVASLLDEAAGLADRVAAPPSGWAAGGSGRDVVLAAIDDLRARLGRVERGYGQLRRAFDQAAGRAAQPGGRPSWRQVDALLRVPTIAVETRMVLLDRALDAGRSPLPAPEAVGSGPAADEPSGDEAFWVRAIGLAKLELGLLRLAGEPVDELRGHLATAEAWTASPDSAFSAMDSLSDAVRRRRAGALDWRHRDRADARSSSSSSEETDESVARDRADRLARTLPAAAVLARLGPSEDPGLSRAARDRFDLLAWHSRRLAEDLAQDLARDTVLAANATGAGPAALAEARDELNRSLSRAIRVENLAEGDDTSRVVGLVVSGGDALPEGLAAVFLRHDPGVDLQASLRGESLVPVPVRDRAERRFDIDFAPGLDVVPTVYYRGQTFDDRSVTLPQVEQVSVAIRQTLDFATDSRGNPITIQGAPIKVADQFEQHPEEGYLHPNSTLLYRLELSNWTDGPLPVVVTQTWDGDAPKSTRVALPAGQSVPDAATGQISAIDFGPEVEARTLTIEVREEGRAGRIVCAPRTVVFRQLKPQQYITAAFHFQGGPQPVVGLYVQHLDTDRTTVPAHVVVTPEPFTAFKQVSAPQWIPRGAVAKYSYRITDPNLKNVKFSLTIDGVVDAIVQERQLQALKDEPPAAPPPGQDDPRMPKL